MHRSIYLLAILVSSIFNIEAQTVTTLLGPNTGINDALVLDSIGNIYGSDFGASTTGASSVYKIDTAGVISTFSTGYSSCNGLDIDHDGFLYVVDFTSTLNTHQVYKLDNSGIKTPYGPSIPGASGIIFDPVSDTLYVSQYAGSTNTISKLSPDGNVTLHCDHGSLNGPVGMAFDSNNTLYVANFTDGEVYKVTHSGDSLTLIADIPNVSFWGVGFLTYASGYLYATGIGVHKIYQISLAGVVTEYAGTGIQGSADGAATTAQFSRPNGIATNLDQDKLYISDYTTKSIRVISGITTSIVHQDGVSTSDFELYQNYPNPATDLTRISYSLENSNTLQLQLFSVDGRLVSTVLLAKQSAGKHQCELDTSSLEPGAYYCMLSSNGTSRTIKIAVEK